MKKERLSWIMTYSAELWTTRPIMTNSAESWLIQMSQNRDQAESWTIQLNHDWFSWVMTNLAALWTPLLIYSRICWFMTDSPKKCTITYSAESWPTQLNHVIWMMTTSSWIWTSPLSPYSKARRLAYLSRWSRCRRWPQTGCPPQWRGSCSPWGSRRGTKPKVLENT